MTPVEKKEFNTVATEWRICSANMIFRVVICFDGVLGAFLSNLKFYLLIYYFRSNDLESNELNILF